MDARPTQSTPPPSSAPEAFWDAKARRSGGDPLLAVSVDDREESRCIDRIQKWLMRRAIAVVERSTALAGKRVLDFGCGTGRWVDFFQERGCRYAGADLSGELLAIAARLHPEAELSKLDGPCLPYVDGSFDLVSSIAVLHHNDYPQQERLLAELVRVLAPGGHLILFEGLGAHEDSDAIHRLRPRDEWRALAESHGLAQVWQRGARYGLLKVLVERLAARMGARSKTGRVRQLARRLDTSLDPYLMPLVPARYHGRVLLLLRKP